MQVKNELVQVFPKFNYKVIISVFSVFVNFSNYVSVINISVGKLALLYQPPEREIFDHANRLYCMIMTCNNSSFHENF